MRRSRKAAPVTFDSGELRDATSELEALPVCTATPATQCRSNPVSGHGLPKTGIFPISAGDYRLFRSGTGQTRRLETGRNSQKSAMVGISEVTQGQVSSCRTAWLATQCRSHRSPLKFPANREFYGEFCILAALRLCLASRSPCAAGTFCSIPWRFKQGIVFEKQGMFRS